FLRTARAVVDVHGEELILRADDEKLIFKRDILLLKKLLNIYSTKDPPPLELNNDPRGDILFLKNLLKDEPSETERSKIYDLIGEPSDTFLMRDEEITFNPLKDIDDTVSIPRVSKTPLDSFDSILDTFESAFTNPLFELDYEYSLNYDNLIFDIQDKDSDKSKTETIMDEVQSNGSQSTAQILPSFKDLSINIPMHNIILSLFRHGMFDSSRLSFYLGLLFLRGFSESHSSDLFKLVDENKVFDPRSITINGRFKSLNEIAPKIVPSLFLIIMKTKFEGESS
nr:hypothetical protein [Tanacetum cinerariifolium]